MSSASCQWRKASAHSKSADREETSHANRPLSLILEEKDTNGWVYKEEDEYAVVAIGAMIIMAVTVPLASSFASAKEADDEDDEEDGATGGSVKGPKTYLIIRSLLDADAALSVAALPIASRLASSSRACSLAAVAMSCDDDDSAYRLSKCLFKLKRAFSSLSSRSLAVAKERARRTAFTHESFVPGIPFT